MRKILDFFLDNRWLVLAALFILIIGGITVMLQLPHRSLPRPHQQPGGGHRAVPWHVAG